MFPPDISYTPVTLPVVDAAPPPCSIPKYVVLISAFSNTFTFFTYAELIPLLLELPFLCVNSKVYVPDSKTYVFNIYCISLSLVP